MLTFHKGRELKKISATAALGMLIGGLSLPEAQAAEPAIVLPCP
ncbi:hypothetical protein [Selenomonas sp. KH1T6]|nr:hypothetical protein SAMN05216583_1663 [Selenomonas ruminantium]